MNTMTVSDISLDATSPAQRLRWQTAAVRVSFCWFGVHRTLTNQQKEEVGESYGADSRLLRAGKKIIDVRHEAFRKLTAIRTRVVNYWRALTLPYTEPGLRLIKQSDIAPFVLTMESCHEELTAAEAELNGVYDQMKADAERRLGRLFDPYDYPPHLRGQFSIAWDFPSVEHGFHCLWRTTFTSPICNRKRGIKKQAVNLIGSNNPFIPMTATYLTFKMNHRTDPIKATQKSLPFQQPSVPFLLSIFNRGSEVDYLGSISPFMGILARYREHASRQERPIIGSGQDFIED
jgi:hypothetical protein